MENARQSAPHVVGSGDTSNSDCRLGIATTESVGVDAVHCGGAGDTGAIAIAFRFHAAPQGYFVAKPFSGAVRRLDAWSVADRIDVNIPRIPDLADVGGNPPDSRSAGDYAQTFA